MKKRTLKKWVERALVGIMIILGILDLLLAINYVITSRMNVALMLITLLISYFISCILERYGRN